MKTEFKPGVVVKPCKSRYHTIADHNFHIRRNGVCPYCLSGSRPVHRSCLDVDGNWNVKVEELIGGV